MDNNWKDKFFKIYFDDDMDIHLKEEQLAIKNENIPKFLYKYQRVKYLDDILQNHFMFLPEIKDLNDPYEGNILYNLTIQNYNILTDISEIVKENPQFISTNNKRIEKKDIDLLQKYISNAIDNLTKKLEEDTLTNDNELLKLNKLTFNPVRKYPPLLKEYENIMQKNTSLICLTEDHKNNPMWAHYADNHKGICIEYDFKKCSDFFKQYCFPVWYDNSQILDNFKIKKMKKIRKKLSFKPFMKKSKDWRCEKEWRIILDKTILKKESKDRFCICDKEYIKFLKPNAVYLGKDISENNENEILEICKSNNIKVFKMKQSYKEYDLDEELIY